MSYIPKPLDSDKSRQLLREAEADYRRTHRGNLSPDMSLRLAEGWSAIGHCGEGEGPSFREGAPWPEIIADEERQRGQL